MTQQLLRPLPTSRQVDHPLPQRLPQTLQLKQLSQDLGLLHYQRLGPTRCQQTIPLHLQMRFRPVVPLKEVLPVVEEGVAVVAERLLLPNPEQYHLDLVLTSQRTSCLAEEAMAP